MRRSRGVRLVLLAVTAVATAQAADPHVDLRDRNGDGRVVILCVGDSVTKGSMLGSYPVTLRKLVAPRAEVVNAAKYGEWSTTTRERLPAHLDEHRPDVVVVQTGINNVLRVGDTAMCPERVTGMVQDLQAMIDTIHTRGAVVLVGTLFAGPAVLDGVPASCAELANARIRRLDVPQVDFEAVVRGRWQERTLDGVHLSGDGAEAIAAAVATALGVAAPAPR